MLCYMPSPPVQKIHSCSDTAFPMSILQAHLLQQSSFLQYALVTVIQLSRYFIFYNRNTSF